MHLESATSPKVQETLMFCDFFLLLEKKTKQKNNGANNES